MDIEDVISSKDVVVLDLGAESWCAPCRALRKHFDAAADAVDATLIRADIDDSPELAVQYAVQGVPTLIAFKDGKQVGYVQSRTAVALIKEINAL